MKENNLLKGHLFAIMSVLFWGNTFISTKFLLRDFKPIEILFFRFIIGYVALLIACPKKLKLVDKKQELTFILAGISGVTLYFLFENIALTYTMASNVGVLVAIAPFFTAFLSFLINRKNKLKINFILGFILAIIGIFLISFNGTKLKLNPIGDLLAIGAALLWAFYSIFVNKIGTYGYNIIQSTRRIFMYGIIFMIPALFFMDFELGLSRFTVPINLFNIIFLGLGASALCFVTWNYALKVLGTVSTTNYIYLVPVITVIASFFVLNENITPLSFLGTFFTLLGLVISELKFSLKGFLLKVKDHS